MFYTRIVNRWFNININGIPAAENLSDQTTLSMIDRGR